MCQCPRVVLVSGQVPTRPRGNLDSAGATTSPAPLKAGLGAGTLTCPIETGWFR
jgi:hypothetical protein